MRLFFALASFATTAIVAAYASGDARYAPATPGCYANAARYDVKVPAHPFAVVQSREGAYAFVSLNSSSPTSPTGVGVLKCESGRYKFSHIVRFEANPTGMSMTHDGKLLVVANDGFVTFVDTAAAIAGKSAVIGSIKDLEGDPEDNDAGSVYTNVTADDRFAFVSDEQNLTITVIDLMKARSNGFSRTAIVGTISVANAPIALSFSRDYRYLFTTSEIARKAYKWPAVCKPEGSPPGTAPENPAGAIITVDVTKAVVKPDDSVVSRTPSDCSPVRMALSPDGATAWVTNRGSNTVTAFDTAKLIAGDQTARVATVPVGSNPVAIAITSDGRYVLAGNTNRFGPGGTTGGTISVIDAARKAVAGTIAAGLFPREFSHGAGATLFLANYRSNTVTVFNESRLGELLDRSTAWLVQR